MVAAYHIPVLLNESIEGLNVKPSGVYVDVTYGGGGHSRAILDRLTTGRLIAIDQDPEAVANRISDPRLILFTGNFRHLGQFLKMASLNAVDGILADLGVSSHQFDTASRGFSLRFDGPLDMRMNQQSSLTAADFLQQASERELQDAFSRFGEVRNARTLAHHIAQARQQVSLQTTFQLIQCVESQILGDRHKYLSQLFQALRIAVNEELTALHEFLEQAIEWLAPAGRLVVISYHSLEDKLVKTAMREGFAKQDAHTLLFGHGTPEMKLISNKCIQPSESEISLNRRAASARMRIAEKRAL